MKSIVTFITHSGNEYCCDINKNQILFCHPIFCYLLRLHKKKIDLVQWMKKKSENLYIDKIGLVSPKEINYYYNKLKFFLEFDYFSDVTPKNILNKKLEPDDIKYALANTINILFEVTNSCNLKCKYCAYGDIYQDYELRKNQELEIDIARSLIKYLVKLWQSSLNSTYHKIIYLNFYGGEPLLNIKFIKEIIIFVQKLKISHCEFKFALTTNALLLKKHMDFLIEHDFGLLISLDGNEKNNEYRVFPSGKPAYKKILSNIHTLYKKHPKYFKDKVRFNAVLHNKNSVTEIWTYFKENFKTIPNINALKFSGVKSSKRNKLIKMYSSPVKSYNQAQQNSVIEKDKYISLPIMQNTTTFIHQYSNSVYQNYIGFIFNDNNQELFPSGTCIPFSSKIFITANGKMLPCEQISQQYYLGRVNNNKVILDFNSIVRRYNDYYKKLRKLCITCYNAATCTVCALNLNIENEKINCNNYMNYNDFVEYLSSHISYLEKNPHIYSKILEE